jgi:carbon monoxide dehydrogenase subunit G
MEVSEMASIRKEISTRASLEDVWAALADIGALHTRLMPGFVVDTRLEPGARIVTFGNGMVVREQIVTIDDEEHRVVWSATGGPLTHHNGSAQAVAEERGGTRVIWIADLLPNEAAATFAPMMEQGMAIMKQTLDRLAETEKRCLRALWVRAAERTSRFNSTSVPPPAAPSRSAGSTH